MPNIARLIRRPLLLVVLALAGGAAWATADWYSTVPEGALAAARYVGRASCIECHQDQARAFHGSDHDRAMEPATDETVLADFNDTEFRRFEERTRFFRDGKRFMVNAEGPDGEYRDYEVKYTFGVRPLQQYMVEFPDGRIQVLRVSWDVEQKRWFFVAPPDAAEDRIEPGDPLHWTGLAQNWNTMCAECHSTDYHKNYNLASNSYKSTFNEIDVSCEACHGPGSVHVELATARSLFWDRDVGYGLANPLKGRPNSHQVETCAPCHSRRAMIHADYRPGDSYFDHFELELLRPGTYHADGQILDEDYEFGSFTQSKMYRKGVRCTDCHDPHSLDVKYDGNRLCAQCHQPGVYDGVGHHHHPNAKAGAAETLCVTCHMPTTTYMGIDERLDHSIRVPRPDLTAKLGTPNACNRCHTKPEEDAQWATAAVAKWFGEKRPDDPHYAVALHAAQTGAADAVAKLKELFERRDVPDIVRATAAELLSVFPDASERLSRRALDDDSPLVRAAAIRGVAARSPLELIEFVAPKLRDPARAVRMAAANRLVANAAQLAQTEFRGQLAAAVKEYRDGMAATLDRAQTHRNLAGLDEAMGDDVAAVKSLRTAIKLEPYLTVPRTELSQLLAAMRDDPTRAAAWKQSGGSDQEIRRLREEEVDLLERDKELLPGDAFVYYHRGQLLFLLDRVDEARMEFEKACELAPGEYEYWKWLALICERQKRWEQGIVALHKMQELRPNDPEWQLLRQKWLRIVQQDQADAAASDGDAGAADADDATRPESEQDSTAGEAAPIDAPAPKPGPEPPTTPGQKESPRPNAAAE